MTIAEQPKNDTCIFLATEQNFDNIVLQQSYSRLVVCDISAEWCAPCRSLMPIITRVAEDYRGRFLLATVDADENMRIAGRFKVRGFPTVIAFVNGEEVERFHSSQRKSFVQDFIERHLF